MNLRLALIALCLASCDSWTSGGTTVLAGLPYDVTTITVREGDQHGTPTIQGTTAPEVVRARVRLHESSFLRPWPVEGTGKLFGLGMNGTAARPLWGTSWRFAWGVSADGRSVRIGAYFYVDGCGEATASEPGCDRVRLPGGTLGHVTPGAWFEVVLDPLTGCLTLVGQETACSTAHAEEGDVLTWEGPRYGGEESAPWSLHFDVQRLP